MIFSSAVADALLKVPWVAGHEGISTTPLSTQEGLREKNQARAEAQKQYEDYLNQMRRAEAGVVNTGGASAKELMDKKRLVVIRLIFGVQREQLFVLADNISKII